MQRKYRQGIFAGLRRALTRAGDGISMRISWNWLKDYVDTALTPHEAAEVLTSTGLEVESVEPFEPVKGMLAGVVVGHVLQCTKHPDADRLSVTLVDLGSGEPVQIVCGAPNVATGQKVLVATVGAILHMGDGGSLTIKRSSIRGQESHGMICAEDELGLGHSHDGILVLDAAAVPGTPAARHLGLVSDHVLEIGLTPNRTDAMGHVGVARDLIAALRYRQGLAMELGLPDVSGFAQDDDARVTAVEVMDAHACPRYCGVTLTQVKVGPSPQWLRDRLVAIGLKPVNNVVDVTNFVQHELGQPLHAFDADRLTDGRVVVRKAAAGEPFTTLDGKERRLDASDLVIADAVKPACIAGVFGGLDSGVTEATTAVFLESACFDAATIRRTARRHALSTDASFRFERGVDPEITVYALKRAAMLLREVAGARVSSPVIDIDHSRRSRAEVRLRFAEVERLTGIAIAPDQVVRALELLDFRVLERTAAVLTLQVPAYRVDVSRPADVIEEILRIHGYDRVPLPARLMVPMVAREPLTLESLRHGTAMHLAARGFREIMTPSLINARRAVESGSAETAALVMLSNPLSSELDALRPTLLTGALQALAHNLNRQQRDLRLFERGRIYAAQGSASRETETLALALTGRAGRESWRAKGRSVERADAQEEVEALLARLGLLAQVQWTDAAHPLLDACAELRVGHRSMGVLGQVKARELRAAEVNQPVLYAELNEEALLDACRGSATTFEEVPRFPAVRRDLSLLLPAGARFEDLRRIALHAERKLLREVGLFDVYEGDKLPAGKKSYALSFILQDPGRTLTDEQVDKAMGRIRAALEKEAGAELRG
ncbi:MAG: phenylalanine--tRNA ligase subunit beta [Flavobacteriales bacterium]|nr:MAG: phenylalanine--tRNA ligase subunit beta [Flavobacteriales bacterium]